MQLRRIHNRRWAIWILPDMNAHMTIPIRPLHIKAPEPLAVWSKVHSNGAAGSGHRDIPTHFAVFDRTAVETMLAVSTLSTGDMTRTLGRLLTGWSAHYSKEMSVRIMHHNHVIVSALGEPINRRTK